MANLPTSNLISSRQGSHKRSLPMKFSWNDLLLVCLGRSRWVPVAILAIWKAGACLVLLDATHPASRLQSIAKQSAVPMAIENGSTRAKASSLCSTVFQIDDDRLWTGNVYSSLAETIYVGGAPRTLSSHLARLEYPEALRLSMLLFLFRGSPSLLDCSQRRHCVFYSFLPTPGTRQ